MAGITARETPTVVSDDKMKFDNEHDVPSPIDLRSMKDARTWAEEVTEKRPWREDFFKFFIEELRPYSGPDLAILEIGSGPGFMAEKIINNISFSRYTALDFSDAMHTLAKERLGSLSNKIDFITRDFLHSDWFVDLPQYNSVITLQAVHELRHKRKAPVLYDAINKILDSNGVFLVCDHYAEAGDDKDTSLYMNLEEHNSALRSSGFVDIKCVLKKGGMVLFRANKD
jgi:hypothetical protein